MSKTSNYVDLSKEAKLNEDGGLILQHLSGVPGGRALVLDGYTNQKDGTDVIRAGHVIIRLKDSMALQPLSVTSEGKYDALPADASIVGLLEYSVTKQDPRAAVLTRGQVNRKLLPYELPADGKAQMHLIEFLYI